MSNPLEALVESVSKSAILAKVRNTIHARINELGGEPRSRQIQAVIEYLGTSAYELVDLRHRVAVLEGKKAVLDEHEADVHFEDDLPDDQEDYDDPTADQVLHSKSPCCKYCGCKPPAQNPEIVAVDKKIEKYIKQNRGYQTYTEVHDNALRAVLYEQERRLRLVEGRFNLPHE